MALLERVPQMAPAATSSAEAPAPIAPVAIEETGLTQGFIADRTTGFEPEVSDVTYVGPAAWRHDEEDGLVPEDRKTWSQWRGYGAVGGGYTLGFVANHLGLSQYTNLKQPEPVLRKVLYDPKQQKQTRNRGAASSTAAASRLTHCARSPAISASQSTTA